jgi:hypothetical protein
LAQKIQEAIEKLASEDRARLRKWFDAQNVEETDELLALSILSNRSLFASGCAKACWKKAGCARYARLIAQGLRVSGATSPADVL